MARRRSTPVVELYGSPRSGRRAGRHRDPRPHLRHTPDIRSPVTPKKETRIRCTGFSLSCLSDRKVGARDAGCSAAGSVARSLQVDSCNVTPKRRKLVFRIRAGLKSLAWRAADPAWLARKWLSGQGNTGSDEKLTALLPTYRTIRMRGLAAELQPILKCRFVGRLIVSNHNPSPAYETS